MLYIHIPFCHSKCLYCDFYSTPSATQFIDSYIQGILNEFDLRINELKGNRIRTVYIGGGTPSILSGEQLSTLLSGLDIRLDINSLEEFTIEANPDDITPERLALFKDFGINRVSIGIQSFNDIELKRINRRHDSVCSHHALESLHRSGLNFSADLIYGLPEQSVESWRRNLSELLSWQPPHFSAYLLSYEPGTPLYLMRQKGKIVEASDYMVEEMYEILCNQADEKGYDHYEISNFGKPLFHAVHNSRYWTGTPYLGLGAGAHSFDGEKRRYNPDDLRGYIKKLVPAGKCLQPETFFTVEEESMAERFNDTIITRLRTSEGLSLSAVPEEFAFEFTHETTKLIKQGLLKINDEKIYIPEEKWLLADEIMRSLIVI